MAPIPMQVLGTTTETPGGASAVGTSQQNLTSPELASTKA